MIQILVVEDDKALNTIVSRYLGDNGFNCISAYDGEEALEKFYDLRPDFVISDIMMPKMDGYSLASAIRKENKEIPILFMSARDDKPSIQYGYHLEIDDYIVKPFDIDELVLKVKAIIRRSNIKKNNTLIIGNLRMDNEEHMAYIDDEELPLTVREFDILFKMLSNPKRTYTRGQLMEEFWDYDSSATSRTVDVYMVKIREKTNKCDGFSIVTVHGLGYKVVLK